MYIIIYILRILSFMYVNIYVYIYNVPIWTWHFWPYDESVPVPENGPGTVMGVSKTPGRMQFTRMPGSEKNRGIRAVGKKKRVMDKSRTIDMVYLWLIYG